jgi:hypothetical protein
MKLKAHSTVNSEAACHHRKKEKKKQMNQNHKEGKEGEVVTSNMC